MELEEEVRVLERKLKQEEDKRRALYAELTVDAGRYEKGKSILSV